MKDKFYTLEELNESQKLREPILERMHQDMIREYYLRLRASYPDIFLTQTFVESQFRRVGFHKMGSYFNIKYVLQQLHGLAYEQHLPIPPLLTLRTACLMPLPPKAELVRRLNERISTFLVQLGEQQGYPVYANNLSQRFYQTVDFSLPNLHFALKTLLGDISFETYVNQYYLSDENPHLIEDLRTRRCSLSDLIIFEFNLTYIQEQIKLFLENHPKEMIINLQEFEARLIQ